MGSFLKSFALAYSAGTIGGIANFLFGFAMAALGVFAALGISLPSAPFPASLYQRMVWGGLWGAMLFLPIGGGVISRGFWLGLGPTLIAGLVVFPSRLGKGLFAIELSPLMPVVIILFNWVWGIATVLSARMMGLR
jgi:hypothetical protein